MILIQNIFIIVVVVANHGAIKKSSLSTNSSWNSLVGSQSRHTLIPPLLLFLGSLPSPKPGNLVILIIKKKHVLFKIPAAKYSAMLFLYDSRIAFAFREP